MDIVIVAGFCGFFGTDLLQDRFMYLAFLLSQENNVEVITGDFIHGTKQYFAGTLEEYPYTVTMLHADSYTRNVSVRRLISHYRWGKRVGEYLKNRKKPDVVYAAMPTLYAAAVAAEYCEKNSVRFIVDVQDLWPEAFRMALNIPVVSDILFSPMKKLADRAYSRADEVVAVSRTYVDRALSVNRKSAPGHTVFLGTRLASFDENVAGNVPALKKPDSELWLGYIGTLGESYDIPCVLKALKLLKDQGAEVPKFIVMGDGPRKQEFMDLADELSVDAVFTGRLSYDVMCATLKQCDITVNPIIRGSAASIINKHSDYAASGLPVLNTQESAEYRELVDAYHMGFNCNNGDENDLAEKLAYLVSHEEERHQMGLNARKCAEEKFDRQQSYEEIISCILKQTNR